VLGAGMYNGQFGVFDLRKGSSMTDVSPIEQSHRWASRNAGRAYGFPTGSSGTCLVVPAGNQELGGRSRSCCGWPSPLSQRGAVGCSGGSDCPMGTRFDDVHHSHLILTHVRAPVTPSMTSPGCKVRRARRR
jgi:hypothetical protein